MIATRRGTAIASTVVAAAVAVGLATSGRAEPADSAKASRERPRGAVEDCLGISGFGGGLREFALRRNLVVGPLALLRAGRTLAYVGSDEGIGNKLFVVVKGGHRVTLELSRRIRRGAGLGFGFGPNQGEVRLRDTRRVVTFIACRRGEYPYRSPPRGWPVSGWVGFLIARSPRCVPLLVWVDDEPTPRRAVVRFGVRDCG